MDGFVASEIHTGETGIFVRCAGSGPPILLLHGFPETHLMWRDVAPLLARDFTVVCADLRGYGNSGCPESDGDHGPYSKRVMAEDMVRVMDHFGFSRFCVAGHDRGGRVAYRMALDHPDVVERLAVLDILPTGLVWERADDRFALAYWPWTLLAQPAPLPEEILLSSPEAIVDDALGGWGSPAETFPPEVRAAYVESLRNSAHTICEEYRAAATIDREHDAHDATNGRRIACPVLAVWGAGGPLDTWYTDEGGPLAIWRNRADDVRGHAVSAGHFFPEENPGDTADELRRFFLQDVYTAGE